MVTPEWFGASSEAGFYMQFRVLRYSKGMHYPVTTFWTDRELSKINDNRVYFFAPGLRRFKKQIVQGSFVLWLDFDDQELPELHLEPSLVVSTGGGYQVYWKFTDFVMPEELRYGLEYFCSLYPTADLKTRDITRFLRWPETMNLKYDPPRRARIESRSDLVYEFDEVVGVVEAQTPHPPSLPALASPSVPVLGDMYPDKVQLYHVDVKRPGYLRDRGWRWYFWQKSTPYWGGQASGESVSVERYVEVYTLGAKELLFEGKLKHVPLSMVSYLTELRARDFS